VWELTFWFSVAVVGYTFLGYPLLVGLLATIRRRPVAKAAFTPEVTVVVAACNSQETIRRKIENCLSQDYPRDKLTVMVTSDGSTDDTNRIVREFGDRNVALLAFDERRGKAACLNDAVARCTTDFIVFADARQRFEPDAVRRLMENFADESVGAVGGELMIEDDGHTGFSQGVDFYWRYEKFIRHSEATFGSVPGVSGAIYALRKSLFQPIPTGTILDDVLIPMNVVFQGKRVGFEPEARAFDIPSHDPKWERRRKIRTLAGNYQLIRLEPRVVLPGRNPIWPQYLSHKVLRLVAPAFLVLAFFANLCLLGPSPVYVWLMVLQALFYGAAVVGLVAPWTRTFAGVRIPMTFCLLNWFAVLGLVEFVLGKKTHLW
jgi:cellulose synthase/poly-beta-1,6-N-acetylglucosamine synthase-like glycosyltransferase